MRTPDQVIAAFWRRVRKSSGCWRWNGALRGRDNAYGYFVVQGRRVSAHRFAYTLERGPIARGMTLDHLCRNTRCVRPDHLEQVTMAENILRGVGATAQNARKRSCIHGHPLSGRNLYVNPNGFRECRECKRSRNLAWWAANEDYNRRYKAMRRMRRRTA